ncbi:MAG: TrmH family RNA methyltransferase [Bdellovibrionales bacterium]
MSLKIESFNNQRFKYYKSLLSNKGLKKAKDFLVFGEKVVAEQQLQYFDDCIEILYNKPIENLKLPLVELSQELFDELDIFGTKKPILLMKQRPQKLWDPQNKDGIEILLPLGDPSNLGSTLRNVGALGSFKFVLLKEAANPYHPKAVRAASGNLFLNEFVFGPSIHELTEPVMVLDSGGKDILEMDFPTQYRLLVGEEGPGVPDKENFQKLSIPFRKESESLNAAFALTCAVFHITSKAK